MKQCTPAAMAVSLAAQHHLDTTADRQTCRQGDMQTGRHLAPKRTNATATNRKAKPTWSMAPIGTVPPSSSNRSRAANQPGKRKTSRSMIGEWRSIRFRLLICAYDAPPCGPSVRVDELAKSRRLPTLTLMWYRCFYVHTAENPLGLGSVMALGACASSSKQQWSLPVPIVLLEATLQFLQPHHTRHPHASKGRAHGVTLALVCGLRSGTGGADAPSQAPPTPLTPGTSR